MHTASEVQRSAQHPQLRGELFSASCYSNLSYGRVPLKSYTSTSWRHGVHVVCAKKKLSSPDGNNQRKEGKEGKHDSALLYYHSFGVALLKELFCWPQIISGKEDLSVEMNTLAVEHCHVQMKSSTGLLNAAICSLLCSTAHQRLQTSPV